MITKQQIFEKYLKEYINTNKVRKGEILDIVTEVTNIHRNASMRKFKNMQLRDPLREDKRGRPVYYTKDVDAALYDVWEAANEPCGQLLHPMIKEYVSIMQRDGQWKHSDEATGKLLSIKEHTVRRKASEFKIKYGKGKGISSTKPSPLKSIIPIFKGPWKNLPPGHGQIDTLAHCGNTLLGDFVYTLNLTDSATYWNISRAQWNKGQDATVENMKAIKKSLPFAWLSAHPDTGSEFINWVSKNWFDFEGIALSRSEPGKKNDNMFVEERNGHVVRKYMGYTRFDNPKVVSLMNELYEQLALYLNHFQVVRRTISSKRVGAKYVRKYEKVPKTPYQRVLESKNVSEDVKSKLREEHEKLNPLILKQKIDKLLEKIFKVQKNDCEI